MGEDEERRRGNEGNEGKGVAKMKEGAKRKEGT